MFTAEARTRGLTALGFTARDSWVKASDPVGQRSKNAERCPRCRLHVERCICEQLVGLELGTRLALVMHRREVKKPTATGPLALEMLSNAALYVHGVQSAPLDLNHLHDAGRRVLVLFPSEDARPLSSELRDEDAKPITLVVPDGNWRQASRVPKRVPGLERALAVTLPEGPKTRWGIRTESRQFGLATFEAIARAYGILESPEVQSRLEAVFDHYVAATLAAKG
jgi:DTW domain-containing protein YfiP